MPALDLNDASTLHDFRDRMDAFRCAATANPIRKGQSFTLKFSCNDAHDVDDRHRTIAPSLQTLVSTSTTWYLNRSLQSGIGENAQVWVASHEPQANEANTPNSIVLKIMQESFTTFPHVDWEDYDIRSYVVQEDRVSNAVTAYRRLSDFQGSVLPYFFGHHVETAPWGERLDILAFEYISGPSMEAVVYHNEEPRYARWIAPETYTKLAKSAIEALLIVHARRILHNDIELRNIFIDTEKCQLVIIDWEMCSVDQTDHDEWVISEERKLVDVLHGVGSSVARAMVLWANSRIPQLDCYVSD
ncbi:hypothetical protein EXIGLDRAFT_843317 [Exidia glandulosa HHB12029]|uniref:Protein kinase domain-containing protein n=1 Tax=Exidia glandulosa HHB12029 TaxID=1314781 RepID=A0A165CRS3_EXIGL|nr:hypothetical protein EXIGLDRAFT_843317 [Exidia glandulosa HHB12029]